MQSIQRTGGTSAGIERDDIRCDDIKCGGAEPSERSGRDVCLDTRRHEHCRPCHASRRTVWRPRNAPARMEERRARVQGVREAQQGPEEDHRQGGRAALEEGSARGTRAAAARRHDELPGCLPEEGVHGGGGIAGWCDRNGRVPARRRCGCGCRCVAFLGNAFANAGNCRAGLARGRVKAATRRWQSWRRLRVYWRKSLVHRSHRPPTFTMPGRAARTTFVDNWRSRLHH